MTLNEPVLPWGYTSRHLKTYMNGRLIHRMVDPDHIVIIEGNSFGNDHTGLLPPFDEQMVYSFHHYIGSSTDTVTMYNQYRTDISVEHVHCGLESLVRTQITVHIKSFFERNDIWSWKL